MSSLCPQRLTDLTVDSRQANAVECLQLLLERKAKPTSTEPGAAMTPQGPVAVEDGNRHALHKLKQSWCMLLFHVLVTRVFFSILIQNTSSTQCVYF